MQNKLLVIVVFNFNNSLAKFFSKLKKKLFSWFWTQFRLWRPLSLKIWSKSLKTELSYKARQHMVAKSEWIFAFRMNDIRSCYIPYRLDIERHRTSSRIVRVAAASGVAQEFRIVLPPKVKTKNSTSSLYSSLYGIRLIKRNEHPTVHVGRVRLFYNPSSFVCNWPARGQSIADDHFSRGNRQNPVNLGIIEVFHHPRFVALPFSHEWI